MLDVNNILCPTTNTSEEMVMKVAIIGAGNVGKALGSSLIRAGHEVTIAASTPESARAAADEIGARAADSSAAAVAASGVAILAIPYGAAEEVGREIAEAASGHIVIDATNPVKPDYSGLATDGSSAAEEFQRRLPDADVVKAFNTIFAANQANPSREIDGYVAGDDADAKRTVLELVESIGFAPVDVGPLSATRHLEGMAWLNISLNASLGWNWTSAWRLDR
jgi:8-hydroxy-5-deazaflavin:NADPH oxidoreductase